MNTDSFERRRKMSDSLEKERTRLFQQDEKLRKEAELVLENTGIGKILKEYGFHPVGSFVMKTMTWRDLNFERYDDEPDCDEQWELGQKLRQLEGVWSLHCNNFYEDPRSPDDSGLYWGLRLSDPQGGEIWRIDLWTARKEEFKRTSPNRDLWESRLNDDTRFIILSIKEALHDLPEYRRTLISAHIYEAVLGDNIRTLDEFMGWWNQRYGTIEV